MNFMIILFLSTAKPTTIKDKHESSNQHSDGQRSIRATPHLHGIGKDSVQDGRHRWSPSDWQGGA